MHVVSCKEGHKKELMNYFGKPQRANVLTWSHRGISTLRAAPKKSAPVYIGYRLIPMGIEPFTSFKCSKKCFIWELTTDQNIFLYFFP